MNTTRYDTIIIGGGPAGAAAAIYGARKKLKTLLITEAFGGQSMISANIENWIGEVKITGLDLAEKLKKHIEAQAGIEVRSREKVTRITENPDCTFQVLCRKNDRNRHGGTLEKPTMG